MRTIEPIPRRRSRSLDDEPLVNSGIPAGRLGNRTFPTASEARRAAIVEAKRLNQAVYPGHSVARSDAHRPGELPHYHVIDPQGNQISGHFFYGRNPYRVKPGREGNLQQSIAAATRDLAPRLSGWQEEYQRLKEKLKSGQANRQEKGRFRWLNHKLRSTIQQKRTAQQLGTEIHASRRSKLKAQREQEGEKNQKSQWLFEAPLAPEATLYTNPYTNPEFYSNPEWEAESKLLEVFSLNEEEWETVGRFKVPRRSAPKGPGRVPRSRPPSCPPVKSTKPRMVYGWSQYKRRVEELPSDQQAILRKVGNEIRMSYQPGCRPILKVQIYGHADWDTPRNPQREKQMSDVRARIVTNWLKNYVGSTLAAKITWDTKGFGATKLKAQPTTEANRKQNRRVEIVLEVGGSGPSPSTACQVKTIKVWSKAFIPSSLPGLTQAVTTGPHAGKTMIPGPTRINDCFLTDQRGFSSSLTASARMHSEIDIDVTAPRIINQIHRCDPTVEVDCEDGSVECTKSGNAARMSFSNFQCIPPCNPSGRVITVQLQGAASNPCFTGSPDIDYRGTIRIEIISLPSGQIAQISFDGFVDAFPAFEMYAAINGGIGVPLFRLNPPPGNTPANLFGGANRPAKGSVRLICGTLSPTR